MNVNLSFWNKSNLSPLLKWATLLYGRNRKALGDVGNLVNVRGVVEVKPNHSITRFSLGSSYFLLSLTQSIILMWYLYDSLRDIGPQLLTNAQATTTPQKVGLVRMWRWLDGIYVGLFGGRRQWCCGKHKGTWRMEELRNL